MSRRLSKANTQMAKNHMERCTTSLFIMEMQIKTTVRHYYTTHLLECLKLERLTTPSIRGDREQMEVSFTAGGNVKYHNPFGRQFGSNLKLSAHIL